MSKRKDSIALFEVIKNRRNEVNLNVPKWMGGQGAEAPQEPAPVPPAAAAPPPSPPAASPQAEAGDSPAEQQGLLTLKLTQTHLILGCMALVFAVVLAAWIGYSLAGGSGPGQTPSGPGGGSLKNQVPPGKHVLAGKDGPSGSAKEGAKSSQPPAGGDRTKGKYYLIIQQLSSAAPKDMTEAQRIQAWVANQGEPATVNTFVSGKKKYYIVWSLRAFDSPSSPEAQDFGRKIEGLGKKYFAEYKTYNFLQRHKGKFDPWYQRCR